MELIYVIVPVYKVEPYLERCIDSILNQTFRNFKLILVDDGSPDNCPAICDRYAAEHENIIVIHQENRGLSAARNAGLDYALKYGDTQNDWISFVDSDDSIHPYYLEYLYRAAKETGTEISGCSYAHTTDLDIDPDLNIEFQSNPFSAEEYWSKKNDDAVVAWGKLYKLYLFKDIIYPVGKINEDTFTTHKLVFQCIDIAYVPTKLYYYFLRDDSIMRSKWSPRKLDVLEAFNEQKKFFIEHNFRNAYETASVSFLKFSFFNLRAMEISHYDKTARDVLKKEMYTALSAYGRDFGYIKAVRLWFKWRIMHRIKKIINRNCFKRAFLKIKRMIFK